MARKMVRVLGSFIRKQFSASGRQPLSLTRTGDHEPGDSSPGKGVDLLQGCFEVPCPFLQRQTCALEPRLMKGPRFGKCRGARAGGQALEVLPDPGWQIGFGYLHTFLTPSGVVVDGGDIRANRTPDIDSDQCTTCFVAEGCVNLMNALYRHHRCSARLCGDGDRAGAATEITLQAYSEGVSRALTGMFPRSCRGELEKMERTA
ncbi:hypothetical protein os4_24970 [Comamonadaceae bacterium OS-4]|nr:hypothetical protein os4_24970 [Comamonadaceae bacterium OS-4]